MPGTRRSVLRIALVAALVVVAAGCDGAARPQQSAFHGVPPALAHDWERQASVIADAASAGDSCRAMRLANSLRGQVYAAEHRVPLRLRSPLVTGVNALADRLTCTVTTVRTVPQKPPPKHKDDHKDHHGHDKHGGGNDH
jgi:hypothetical protein